MRCLIISLALLLCSINICNAELTPPQNLKAFDVRGDRGDNIGLSWDASNSDSENLQYIISQSSSKEGPYEEIKRFPANENYKSDSPKNFGYSNDNINYHFIELDAVKVDDKPVQQYYKLAITDGNQIVEASLPVTAIPKANWYAPHKTNNLIIMLFCSGFILFYIDRATKYPEKLFIRKLAGLEAIDEAIGRATEMGKPILYLTGYHDMDRVSTIASVNILSHVAQKVADYDSRLMVPSKWSIAMTVCQEVVKEAYMNAGRPDAYNPHDVYFIAGEQFSFTAAVDGVIVREKPAANFFLGTFAAESLILAETGASTGAIQISGTDSAYQIPFFVVACDYCLIGEELYAASAYMSREPKLLGSLKGQDAGKVLIIAAIIIGTIMLLIGELLPGVEVFNWVKNFFIPL